MAIMKRCVVTHEGCCSTFISSSFHESVSKDWEAQEMQKFVVFIAALTFFIVNGKILINTLLQALSLIRF